MAKNGGVRKLWGVLTVVSMLASVVMLGAAPSASAGPKPNAKKYAVIVGVDNYPGRTHKLVGSVGDAWDLHDALIRAGWPKANINMVLENSATAANIRNAMNWLISKADDNSFSVFHYSGHIKQIKSGNKDGDPEVLDEYLWPYDSKFISDGEFGTTMRNLRGWSWVDIAGCEAAGMNDQVAAFNRFFTGSSMENEKSFESPQWRNSVYTGLMIDFGFLQRQGDLNGDKRITLQEAFEYANRNAPRLTANQKPGPQHPYRAGGESVEWSLDPQSAPAPAPAPSSSGGSQPSQPPPSQPAPQPTTTTTAPCRHNCEPGDDPSR